MPKRKRSKDERVVATPTAVAAVETEQERAARLFADSVKSHEAADRAETQRRADAAKQAATQVELQAARVAAADRIKQLRASGGKREQMAEAEATYRAALAAVQEFETGERPSWAPAPAAEVEEAAAAEEATDDSESDEPQPE